MLPLRGGAQCGEAYAGTQVAAIDLRYKFSTGPKSTGQDVKKNENRPYSVNVNSLEHIEFRVEAGLAPVRIGEATLACYLVSANGSRCRTEKIGHAVEGDRSIDTIRAA
jgi:hypothetical protein